MLAALPLLTLLLPQSIQIDGLRTGERFEELGPARAVDIDVEQHRQGRVVDAFTGRPVRGAAIETWTEEITAPGAGFRRVGEARSAQDGGFRVRVREGALVAEKMRVRATGYLTYPGVIGDLDLVRLMPHPGWSPTVRVVDLADRPIPGARITTTYSCAHDLAAFELVTDAFGIAVLEEYGLQDQVGDLRLRASGYGARKYIDPSRVPADPAGGSATLLRLAPRRTFSARIVDREGRPLVGQPLHLIEGDGYHVRFTAEDGRFAIPSCYDGRNVSIALLRDGKEKHVFSGYFPRDTEVTLADDYDGWLDDTPLGTIVLVLAGLNESERRPPLHLYHEDGWAESIGRHGEATLEVEFPAGAVQLSVGSSFSGWEEQLIRVQVEEGERLTVELTPEREPRLTIMTPPEDAHRILVQVGDESIDLDPQKSGEQSTYVPSGAPVTVFAEGDTIRRLALPPLESDAVADLRPQDCLLPPTRAQLAASAARAKLLVHVLDPEGQPLAGRLESKGPGRPTEEELGPGEFRVEGSRGYAAALRVAAKGYAECWTSWAWTGEPDAQLTLRPTRLASLVIETADGSELVVEGPEADRLDELHPGPLTLLVTLGDGRRVALSLTLEPGEERHVRLR